MLSEPIQTCCQTLIQLSTSCLFNSGKVRKERLRLIGDVKSTAMALEAYPEAYPCGSRRELIGGEITPVGVLLLRPI